MLSKFNVVLALLSVGSMLGGCVVTVDDGGDDYTKDEARELKGIDADGRDICALEGWYGDEVCDDFCVDGDPDCESGNCPDPSDPKVSVIGAPGTDTCSVVEFECPEGSVSYNSAECGCGCIESGEGATCGGDAQIQCAEGQFCYFDECNVADAIGNCAVPPEVCPEVWAPVCGCDGVTYSSSCDAAGAGASIAHEGECDDSNWCGGPGMDGCGEGEFCKFDIESMCGANDGGGGGGVCEPIPEACTEEYAPVCGCDGVTYSNECFANGAGVSVALLGECEPTGEFCGGIAGIECGEGEYCHLVDMCGGDDSGGTCEPIPGACPDVYDPVCGCDGQTYGNECEAAAVGVSVSYLGVCAEPAEACGGKGSNDCGEGLFCNYTIGAYCGFADALGSCQPVPEACDASFDPVCGCDGTIYSNECVANAAGVARAPEEVCTN